MVELIITDDQISRAKDLFDFDNLNGSITKGKSQIYGALGEIIVCDYYEQFDQLDVKHKNTYDYDLIINDLKVDVKTKRTTVTPKPHYYCSVSDFNTKQKCDAYIFVRVKEDFSCAWILGSKTKENFYRQSTFKQKGEPDGPRWTFKDDCYNIEISKLKMPRFWC